MTPEQEDRLLQIVLENINVSFLKIAKFERTWLKEQRKRDRNRKNAMTDKQKSPAVQIDAASWDAGYTAGKAGKSGQPPDGLDEFAYFSGIIEGKADRSKPAEQRKSQNQPEPTP